MGFAVVHMQKFHGGDLGGLQSHINREHKPKTNRDIDYSRSELNYDVNDLKSTNFKHDIDKRLKNIKSKRKIRENAVKLCSFIITSDTNTLYKDFSQEQRDNYFRDAVKFFEDRYGNENILYAKVHLDEKTPHLHLGVIPIANKNDKLSAKDVFNKQELIDIQTDFARDIGAKYNLMRGKRNSQAKHIEMQEFKLKTAIEKEQQALQHSQNIMSAAEKNASTIRLSQEELQKIDESTKSIPFNKIVLDKENYYKISKIAFKEINSNQIMEILKEENKLLKNEISKFKIDLKMKDEQIKYVRDKNIALEKENKDQNIKIALYTSVPILYKQDIDHFIMRKQEEHLVLYSIVAKCAAEALKKTYNKNSRRFDIDKARKDIDSLLNKAGIKSSNARQDRKFKNNFIIRSYNVAFRQNEENMGKTPRLSEGLLKTIKDNAGWQRIPTPERLNLKSSGGSLHSKISNEIKGNSWVKNILSDPHVAKLIAKTEDNEEKDWIMMTELERNEKEMKQVYRV